MQEIKRDHHRFYIGESAESATAEITFVPTGDDKYTIDHTYVSEILRGQGIAQMLLNKVVELARRENKKIIPLCSYAKKVMTGNKEYEDVLAGNK